MKALFIDHFFEQDIASLLAAAPAEWECRVVSVTHWSTSARRYFPAQVFCDLSSYWSDELAPARRRWAHRARSLLRDIYLQFAFDVILTPSDTFFYLFDVVSEAKRLGVPVIVVQKETTITDYTMEQHSQQLRRWAPFSSTYMTVCSERHKRFWVRAGADPSRIEVTGQPRFDFYFTGTDSQNGPATASRRSLLFFSYDLNAYSETAQGTVSAPDTPWRSLRDDTTDVLIDVAARNGWELVIKPHPQQDRADVATMTAALRDRAKGNPGLRARVAHPGEDARELIRRADTVVGFQTTALFEAAAAHRRVLYTGWGEQFWRQKEILIPFHEWPGFIHTATSPNDLSSALESPLDASAETKDGWMEAFLDYLGPSDGQASVRTWRVIGRVMHEERDAIAAAAGARRAFRAGSRAWRWRERGRAWIGLAAAGAGLVAPLPLSLRRKLRETARAWSQRLAEIAGHFPEASALPRMYGLGFTSLSAFTERTLRQRLNLW